MECDCCGIYNDERSMRCVDLPNGKVLWIGVCCNGKYTDEELCEKFSNEN